MERPGERVGAFRRRSHGALVTLLVLLGLVPVIALSWRAVFIAQSHRTAAESALRDYAELSAYEYSQRLYRTVFGSTVGQAFNPFTSSSPLDRRVIPRRDPLFSKDAGRGNDSYYLVRRYFLYDVSLENLRLGELSWHSLDPEHPRHEIDPLASPIEKDALAVRLGRFLEEAGSGVGDAAFLTAEVEGALRFYCCRVRHDGSRVQDIYGFECEPDQMRGMLAACAEGPVLPEPLTGEPGEQIDDTVISIGLWTASGQLLFESALAPGDTISARRTLDAALGGLEVDASVRTDFADQLLIGGIPPSRIPEISGLLLVALLLVIATWVLVRREVAVARLRADFVASVSHELRTPLAQIRLFVDTLRLGRMQREEDRARGLEVIGREARRLELLLENVLQFSRAERRDLPLHPRSIELGPWVEDVLNGFRPLAAAREVTVEGEVENGVTVRADAEALRRVLLNLLDNAVKYGPSGQTVRVGGRAREQDVEVWVDDQGPGIEPLAREKVWRKYWRSSDAERSAIAGTGIGLAVVRELVERMEGTVSVGATPDGGARFVCRLPLGEPETDRGGEQG